LGDGADYGWCGSHSPILLGLSAARPLAPDGAPRAFALASPKRDEYEGGLKLLERAERAGGEIVIGDKGYAGRRFSAAVSELDAMIVRPARKNEPEPEPESTLYLDPIRQRTGSIFWTCKGTLTLERHGARTCTTCAFASPSAFWRWPRASRSITGSGVRAARWSTTSPESVESTVL